MARPKSTPRSRGFDIAPFALPNTPPDEIRFEEARDIEAVEVVFEGAAPAQLGLAYWRKSWPGERYETRSDLDNPCRFGWIPMDDWFNGEWQEAAVRVHRPGKGRATIAFAGLSRELPGVSGYDVSFRRTLGLRLLLPEDRRPLAVRVLTRSSAVSTRLRVELDAGRHTRAATLRPHGYNLMVGKVSALQGVREGEEAIHLGGAKRRGFEVLARHMIPSHRYAGDDAHLTFDLGSGRRRTDRVTVSLSSLRDEGPVWCVDQGMYVALADDETTFDDYRQRHKGGRTLAARVRHLPEQSLAGALAGQPRAHPVYFNLGVKHERQRFVVEPKGDVVLPERHVHLVPGRDTPRHRVEGTARLSFGLDEWLVTSRFADPAPSLIYNLQARRDSVVVEQRSLAVPLTRSILEHTPTGDGTVVALVRFRFRNAGGRAALARLPVRHLQKAQKAHPGVGEVDELSLDANRITSPHQDSQVVRCAFDTDMSVSVEEHQVVLHRELLPGESCEAVLKIPFISLDSLGELRALEGLDFGRCDGEVQEFWRRESARGAAVRVPEPRLQELHAAHLSHVQVTDFSIPDGSGLLQTSVGTSTYGNFCNESCMIIQELDQRGLHEEARRRLETWVKYQGTVPLPGNFSDCEGVFYGCNGFEGGTYNQHHGWVLWGLCEHFFLTGDRDWFGKVAESVVAGADWVFRQRQLTGDRLPHSRGWERGFLPAGSLEDVQDFYYWLSTNALTWRGTDAAARALERVKHRQARRVRAESDAYRRDLVRGFETMRQHAPLVKLRDGRWVPHYPSRLYCRGRDLGWIRETLEGSAYLLLSGLYPSTGKRAAWTLDDFQDNRYPGPPYGYRIEEFEANWFDRAGFSIQPNLLAGLLPYLERDEVEVYLWMFFNALAACYREEIGAIVEHPYPVLGYSNQAHFKTSDQANSVMWLRYMLVWWNHERLHLGRAIPRRWLAHGEEVAIEGVATYYGRVSAQWRSEAAAGRISLTAEVEAREKPPKLMARFRHPEGAKLASVLVNGKAWGRVDVRKGDVDLTGLSGRIEVEARY
ncbi:hypothetical protein ACFL6X_01410 [Candidatus Latescibacterota bacterium]